MENKVVLYNSNDIKIGETFVRRARQLVRQQRAAWVDESETAIRFAPGMENMTATAVESTEEDLAPNQLCFARHWTGYYYPAIIWNVFAEDVKLSFLFGHSRMVSKEYVMSLPTAFETMEFQSNWGGWFPYRKGRLTSHQPLIMKIKYGAIEEVELKSLRCKPKKRGTAP